jgi:hypothetical protein
MEISVKSVQVMALESGLPESLVERHLDALCTMALRTRISERKVCLNKIRAWYFSKQVNKPQLFEVLEDK